MDFPGQLSGNKSLMLFVCCVFVVLILGSRNWRTSELSQAVNTQTGKVGKHYYKTLKTMNTSHYKRHSVGFEVIDKDGKDLRCKTRSLGCFQLVNSATSFVTRQRSLLACLLECSEKKHRYFGKLQDKCYCADDTKGFVDSKKWKLCPQYLTNGSNNTSVFEVLWIVERCHQEFTSDDQVEKFKAGCVYLPKGIISRSKFIQSRSIRNCMRECEDEDYTIALYQLQNSTCLCSYGSTLFTNATLLQDNLRKCEISPSQDSFHIYHTHVDDQICTSRGYLRPNESPLTMLASAPGSGNTWVRYLLEVATGIYTGSVYDDETLRKGGFIGEILPYNSGQTFVVKDHLLAQQNKHFYDRSVILVRNPFRALLADYHRFATGGHVDSVNAIDSKVFKRAMLTRVKLWTQMYESYFTYTRNDKILVYYEDLKRDLVLQMKRIINFLPQNLVAKYIPNVEQRLVCLLLDHTGSFKRPSRKLPDEIYDIELGMVARIEIEKVNELFERNGFDRLPESYKEP